MRKVGLFVVVFFFLRLSVSEAAWRNKKKLTDGTICNRINGNLVVSLNTSYPKLWKARSNGICAGNRKNKWQAKCRISEEPRNGLVLRIMDHTSGKATIEQLCHKADHIADTIEKHKKYLNLSEDILERHAKNSHVLHKKPVGGFRDKNITEEADNCLKLLNETLLDQKADCTFTLHIAGTAFANFTVPLQGRLPLCNLGITENVGPICTNDSDARILNFTGSDEKFLKLKEACEKAFATASTDRCGLRIRNGSGGSLEVINCTQNVWGDGEKKLCTPEEATLKNSPLTAPKIEETPPVKQTPNFFPEPPKTPNEDNAGAGTSRNGGILLKKEEHRDNSGENVANVEKGVDNKNDENNEGGKNNEDNANNTEDEGNEKNDTDEHNGNGDDTGNATHGRQGEKPRLSYYKPLDSADLKLSLLPLLALF